MNLYYRLEGKTVVPCTSIEEMNQGIIHVRRDELIDINVSVSTVFIGIGFGDNPLLFETMIFGGRYNHYQRRYYTYEEAEQGHLEALDLVFTDQSKELGK